MSTDKDWEKWGTTNPYYGVLSQKKFLGKRLPTETLNEFYRSGESDIDYIFSNLNKIGLAHKKFRLAVDYGCGVGRLTIPIAKRAKKTVGYDVSPAMIETAQTAASKHKNVEFKVVDADMKNLPDSFDYLNSYIVFQHIPPASGMNILDNLFGKLEHGGVFALQLTFGYDRSLVGRALLYLRERVALVRYAANLLRKRPMKTPNMRMHSYDLNEVNELLYRHGVREYGSVLTNHGGYWGVFLFGVKS